MNKLIVNNEVKLIPSGWKECPDAKKVDILEQMDLQLPRAVLLLRVLWLLLGWEKDQWYWLKAWAIRFCLIPEPKKKSDFWWKWQYLSRMTDEQRHEWLKCVEWIEQPIAFAIDKPNMFVAPSFQHFWKKNHLELPLPGLSSLRWGQFIECDQYLRQFQGGDQSALDDFIANLYQFDNFKYDKNKVHVVLQVVTEMKRMEKILIWQWYVACLQYIEQCHPRVFKKPSESADAPDPYGLVGLTHRLASSVSDVEDVLEMDTWTLLANFEIKLADEEKRPQTPIPA